MSDIVKINTLGGSRIYVLPPCDDVLTVMLVITGAEIDATLHMTPKDALRLALEIAKATGNKL